MNNLIYGTGLQTPPRASYIVCATPRSGSTYLCEALKQTNIAGCPDEYFLHWHRAARTPENLDKYNKRAIAIDRLDYIKGVIERGSRNNVFGIKIMQSYLDLILQEFQRFSPTTFASKAELLQSYFPNLHYIYLSRTDKVRQAVSWAKAVQSGEWEAYYWTPLARAYKYWISSGSRPVFNFQQIQAFYKTLLDQSEKWEAFFQECAIEPYRIEYESFIGAYDQTIHGILSFLKSAAKPNTTFRKPPYRRQSDPVNDDWTRRFLEESKQ